MPTIKTEVETRTRANVAYAAALLDLSESAVYGIVLDAVAGRENPMELTKSIERWLNKGDVKLDPNSQNPQ